MKKQGIEKTMKKRKFFTEKRRLESQELQFFMMSSDNRKLRVKHGAKLFEVLKDQQQVNQQPLSLIETAVPQKRDHLLQLQNNSQLNISNVNIPNMKSSSNNVSQVVNSNNFQQNLRRVSSTVQHSRMNSQRSLNNNQSQPNLLQNQKSYQLLNNTNNTNSKNNNNIMMKGVLLSDYVKDTRFNPIREISKERNITDFFQQKYLLLNEYLNDHDTQDPNNNFDNTPQPIKSNVVTAFMRSKQQQQNNFIKRRYLNRAMSQMDLQNKINQQQKLDQNNLNKYRQKSKADQFIEQIEQQVTSQVEQEWRHKYNIEAEQLALKMEIQKISEHSKRRIQMFIDPRSQKIRQNFQVLNKNLEEIKKLDPKMNILQGILHKKRLSTGQVQTRDLLSRQSMDKINTQDWKMKSNAEILHEILQVGRK